MELKMESRKFCHYEMIFNQSALVEAEGESVVPDFCPDILRMLGASGTVSIRSKEASAGRITVRGNVRVHTLFLPENGRDICPVTMTLPFEHVFDVPGATEDSEVFICANLRNVEAMAQNPRKISARAFIMLRCRVFEKRESEFATNFADLGGKTIEKMMNTQNVNTAIAVKCRMAEVTDMVTMPQGKPEIGEILREEAAAYVRDVKAINNKLILKGEVMLSLLYLPAQGENPLPLEHSIPFSQIMEMDGVTDDCNCEVSAMVTDLGIEPARGGISGDYNVTVMLDIQGIALRQSTLEFMSDAYAIDGDLKLQMKNLCMTDYFDTPSKGVSVREMLDAGQDVSEIVDAQLNMGRISMSSEGENIMVDVEMMARMITKDGSGDMMLTQKMITANVKLQLPAFKQVVVDVEMERPAWSISPGSGVDLRLNLMIRFNPQCQTEVSCISSADMEELPADAPAVPSIIIRYAGEGERFWDIAKRYRTPRHRLFSANRLEPCDLVPKDLMLLIPCR